MFKLIIQKKLEYLVRRYLKRHVDIKLVIVTGSVGKTSTKMAIATVLSERFRVRAHEGNHNAEISSPLAILGIDHPDTLKSIRGWLSVFRAAKMRINEPSDVDVIVQEVGSDRIGQVPHFGTYARPNIAVVTAVSPEHMEYFGTLDAVAAEELSAANFSEIAIINRDDIDGKYAADLTNQYINTYGTSSTAEYHFVEDDFSIEKGFSGSITVPEWEDPIVVSMKVVGEHNIRPLVAAAAVAVKLGMNADEIKKGIAHFKPVFGRMNMLRGVENTTIIDDTYNSSPLAASAAIRTLYGLSAPQRILVLGDMNELGATGPAEHQMIGAMCDSSQLAWVVTVGELSEKYTALAAREKGCQVRSFKNALEAGSFVHSVLEPGAVIMFKGSQGGIYLEEAIKIILHSTQDESQLVRQSPDWLKKKTNFFSEIS